MKLSQRGATGARHLPGKPARPSGRMPRLHQSLMMLGQEIGERSQRRAFEHGTAGTLHSAVIESGVLPRLLTRSQEPLGGPVQMPRRSMAIRGPRTTGRKAVELG